MTEKPTQLGTRSWWGVLKRTIREYQDDNLTDWAAALTYYAVLSIFPAALVGVGLLGALWSASGYVGAFMRASNVIYEVPEGRPFWKLRPLQIVVTVVITLLVALVAIAIVLTGPLAKAVGDVIGLGGAAVTAWSIAKWPVLFLVVLAIVAVLYYAAPNVRLSGFRWITPGTVLAVVVWLVASAGFGLYVAAFSSYNKTYGTLGAGIVFLVW